jgi:hypothetical protein
LDSYKESRLEAAQLEGASEPRCSKTAAGASWGLVGMADNEVARHRARNADCIRRVVRGGLEHAWWAGGRDEDAAKYKASRC